MLHSCSTSEQGSAFDPSQDLILGAKSSSLFIAIVQHCYDNGYHTSEPSQAKSVKSSHVWAMSVKPCCCCICQAKSYKSGQVSQVKSVKSSHVVVAYVLVSLSHAVFSLLSLTAECIVKVYLDRFRRKLCNLQDTCVIFLCLWVHTASVHLCHSNLLFGCIASLLFAAALSPVSLQLAVSKQGLAFVAPSIARIRYVCWILCDHVPQYSRERSHQHFSDQRLRSPYDQHLRSA